MNNNDEIDAKNANPKEVVIRDKTNLLKKSKSKNNLDDVDSEHKISSLQELIVGDHAIITVDQEHKSYCHVLVEKIDLSKNLVDVIYFDDTQTQCSLNEYDQNKASCRKVGVKKSQILVDFKLIEVYVVEYAPNQCLPPEETIEKAKKFIGQTKYNVFANNDEHFCIYCKTGKAAKLFVINPKDLTAQKIIGKSIPSKIVGNLAQEGGQVLLVSTAKQIATKFPRSAIAAGAPAAAEAAGGLLGAGIEGVSMSYDIYKKHKDLKEGKINDVKFKKYIAKRVTRGVNSVAGGVAGGIIGQIVIPIPVVGAVVGGLVGGIVGAAVGHGEGILLGELVEVIDTKIKDKKAKSSSNDAEALPDLISDQNAIPPSEIKEKNQDQIEEETSKKFHVIDKLVFKYDKDLLKSENFVHLEIKKKTSDDLIINDANTKINDDDYEIYVLNDTNEILTELNKIEQSVSEDGHINKRASIEAFSADKLPSNINVFFKILEE